MIKAITFDQDGVYFVNGKSNFVKNIVAMGVSEAEAKRVFLDSDEMKKLYKIGKWSDEEFWQWAIKEWKLDKTVKNMTTLLIAGYEVDERVVEVVKRVRADGFKTLICTDNFPARIDGLQQRFGFLDNFDVKVFSFEIGATKSSPEIYKELIKRANVLPEEIVFADDEEKKLMCAKELGINTFVYENFYQFLGELKKLGVTC
jgi:HAD superfamily hydrolase (TIGR01509 family)